MAHEKVTVSLWSTDREKPHAPYWYGGLGEKATVIGSVDGLEHKDGLHLTASGPGIVETEWEKVGTAERKKQFGIVAPLVNVSFMRRTTEGRGEGDVELLKRIKAAGKGSVWLAVYGYEIEFMGRSMKEQPAHQGAVYLGDTPGEIPEELQGLFVPGPGTEPKLVSYPAISRGDGYDNPIFYATLRNVLPITQPVA